MFAQRYLRARKVLQMHPTDPVLHMCQAVKSPLTVLKHAALTLAQRVSLIRSLEANTPLMRDEAALQL